MATSAFKSTSKRTTIGGSISEDPSTTSRSHRRSRSHSRFSRPEVASEPKGKFVNTGRGSGDCTEISLDDLAIEFFSLRKENESDEGAVQGEREGLSVSHHRGESGGGGSEIGRWASDTASSRRRGRSVSRSGGSDSKRSIVSSGSGGGGKSVTPAEAGSRRRRSLSVARYHISDSESEVDNSHNPSNRAIVKGPIRGRSQIPSSRAPTTLNNQQLEISLNKKDQLLLHDGYSSHSSALTDDESKTVCIGRNGFEKTIQAVYAEKKAELHTEDAVNSGLYEAMKKELRFAVEEIRNELNQAMVRDLAALSNGNFLQVDKPEVLRDFSLIRNSYTTKLEQSEKRKQDLLTEILLEEQRGQDLSKIVKDLLPDSKTSSVSQKPSRARKRSSDKSRASKQLSEEAEKYFVDFISNVEDTDISSFDGERSDGSSTIGGTRKARDSSIRAEMESYQSPVEMEGVLLPWLKWETSPHGSLSGKSKAQTPVTPKALQWDSEKDGLSVNDLSNHSNSSHGSWSPRSLNSTPLNTREYNGGKTRQFGDELVSHFNTDEYLKLKNSEEVLFEMYKERNRIKSGGLLLCNSVF
ncbi:Hypothetical predicted protein [Olea europaea subsp. europaea]|uniref:Uncharacterized protein n=1 Tax=Olea europaea subsp. europaea TaxID=158383 RepID=A0A8S0SCZ3_OLEEU|nr:Hypothetical predicted protein [Olea europaea subsp. europaea]